MTHEEHPFVKKQLEKFGYAILSYNYKTVFHASKDNLKKPEELSITAMRVFGERLFFPKEYASSYAVELPFIRDFVGSVEEKISLRKTRGDYDDGKLTLENFLASVKDKRFTIFLMRLKKQEFYTEDYKFIKIPLQITLKTEIPSRN